MFCVVQCGKGKECKGTVLGGTQEADMGHQLIAHIEEMLSAEDSVVTCAIVASGHLICSSFA